MRCQIVRCQVSGVRCQVLGVSGQLSGLVKAPGQGVKQAGRNFKTLKTCFQPMLILTATCDLEKAQQAICTKVTQMDDWNARHCAIKQPKGSSFEAAN